MRWRTGCLISGSCAVLLAGAGYIALRSFAAAMDFRCAEHPPIDTYVRYLGKPPVGVTDIRSAGYWSFGGASLSLRFQATDSALQTITREYQRQPDPDAAEVRALVERIESLSEAPTNLPEVHQVRWRELLKCAHPEVYRGVRHIGAWEDTLVVDRRRHRVYYYHWNG